MFFVRRRGKKIYLVNIWHSNTYSPKQQIPGVYNITKQRYEQIKIAKYMYGIFSIITYCTSPGGDIPIPGGTGSQNAANYSKKFIISCHRKTILVTGFLCQEIRNNNNNANITDIFHLFVTFASAVLGKTLCRRPWLPYN